MMAAKAGVKVARGKVHGEYLTEFKELVDKADKLGFEAVPWFREPGNWPGTIKSIDDPPAPWEKGVGFVPKWDTKARVEARQELLGHMHHRLGVFKRQYERSWTPADWPALKHRVRRAEVVVRVVEREVKRIKGEER